MRTGQQIPLISTLDTARDSIQLIVTKLLCGKSCSSGNGAVRRTPPLTHRRTLKIYYLIYKVDSSKSYNNLMTYYAYNYNNDIINTTSNLRTFQFVDFIYMYI